MANWKSKTTNKMKAIDKLRNYATSYGEKNLGPVAQKGSVDYRYVTYFVKTPHNFTAVLFNRAKKENTQTSVRNFNNGIDGPGFESFYLGLPRYNGEKLGHLSYSLLVQV